MKNLKNIAIVVALIVATGMIFTLKQSRKEPASSIPATAAASISAEAGAPQSTVLPRLVDLGAKSCVPCKMMAPILDELKTEYAAVFVTEFIDVWKDPEPGQKYGIRVIPTQIFFDAEGREVFRHEGFFGKEDILNKWKEFGVDLSAAIPSASK